MKLGSYHPADRQRAGRVFLLGLLLLTGSRGISASEPLTVYTVNYPLQYFAERIGGERAEVRFPAPPHVDPPFWKPDEATVNAYQQADLILLNGASYANWIARVSLPSLRLVDSSRAFRDRYIHVEDTVTHSHGPAGEHAHSGTAFTTWLDFRQASQQARAVMAALARKLPEFKPEFEKNYLALGADLLRLDREIQDMVSASPDQPLLASHPVYQYLARRYRLNLESVMWEPDQVPGPLEWAELERRLGRHPAKWMIWEADPLPESAARLKALGLQSLVFHPCGNRPQEGDFLSVMSRNVENLGLAFR